MRVSGRSAVIDVTFSTTPLCCLAMTRPKTCDGRIVLRNINIAGRLAVVDEEKIRIRG